MEGSPAVRGERQRCGFRPRADSSPVPRATWTSLPLALLLPEMYLNVSPASRKIQPGYVEKQIHFKDFIAVPCFRIDWAMETGETGTQERG